MPGHIRALIVIMVLSLAVMYLSRASITASLMTAEDFKRRCTVWITLTLLAFLTHHYWLFIAAGLTVVYVAGKRDSNRYCLYLFLLFVVPPYTVELGGLGLLASLIQLDHYRWLSLVLLLPMYVALRARPDTVPFGRQACDIFVGGYIVLYLILQSLTAASLTIMMRTATYSFLDLFLPYYVASRALRSLPQHRDAIASLTMALVIMAPVAAFEYARYWLLYDGLNLALGLPAWGWGGFTVRGGELRASATTGHPIVLGYCMAVGIALVMYLRGHTPNPKLWWLALLTLCAGLIGGLSRGPWVGAAAGALVFIVTGPKLASSLVRLAGAALVALPVLMTTQSGQKILDYLPFVGTVEAHNVEFRQRLFDVSMQVFWNFPWFGALNYLDHPIMDQMRGADGLIDMVNSYLAVAMSTGFVGLTLFVGPFIIVVLGLLRALYTRLDPDSDEHLMGRALLAAMAAIMVTIATVSSVTAVPYVYVAVIGISVSYLRMVQTRSTVIEPVEDDTVPAMTVPGLPPRAGYGPSRRRGGGLHTPRPQFGDGSKR